MALLRAVPFILSNSFYHRIHFCMPGSFGKAVGSKASPTVRTQEARIAQWLLCLWVRGNTQRRIRVAFLGDVAFVSPVLNPSPSPIEISEAATAESGRFCLFCRILKKMPNFGCARGRGRPAGRIGGARGRPRPTRTRIWFFFFFV